MFFKTRFNYDDAAADTTGGADVTNEPAKTTPTDNQPPQQVLTQDLFGFDSKEELADFITQNRETAEQKVKKTQLEEAEFINYSVKNDLLNLEDVQSYKTLASRKDEELVFEKYVQEWKEDNPDIVEADEIAEQSKDAFREDYKLDAEGKKAKERVAARITREAKDLRSPISSRYDEALSQFKIDKNLSDQYPAFDTFVDKTIEKIGTKVSLLSIKDGEEEIPFEAELTEEDKAEIGKSFKTERTFLKYSRSATKEEKAKMETTLEGKIKGFIRNKYFETGMKQAYEIGKGKAIAKGSNVGAFNSFGSQGNRSQSAETKGATVQESNERIASDRQRYRDQGR